MKILILGINGYIGHALAARLLKDGHEVSGIDNCSREERVKEIGSESLIPQSCLLSDEVSQYTILNIANNPKTSRHLESFVESVMPDVIVHLAQMPSAPYSMIDAAHAWETQRDNVLGNLNLLWVMKEICPDAHLLKLGTMGEYGTPSCTIPEGTIEYCLDDIIVDLEEECPMAGLPFPRSPGSFYHLSKVHDTYNCIFTSRIWNIACTDIMQGIVFGTRTPEVSPDSNPTRFDYDEHFGTVINRFCVQAVAGVPLTVYGAGGQTRGYLPLKDSVECLTLAIKNPPKKGEYRVFNQFAQVFSVKELAEIVRVEGNKLGLCVQVSNIPNPRKELEEHEYDVIHEELGKIGYKPNWNIHDEVRIMLADIISLEKRIKTEVIMPKTTWE